MKYQVGDQASFSKTVTETDVVNFAGLSGDFNPVHINELAARKSMFGRRIAHGMLGASFISTVLGTQYPGEGTIYLGQNLSFKKPVYLGDTLTATVEVIEVVEGKNKLRLKTTVTNQDDVVVIEGEALVIPPSQSSEE